MGIDENYSGFSNEFNIVFESGRDGNSEIYVMNNDGSDWKPMLVTGKAFGFLGWSPDGANIIFELVLDGNWDIYSINRDGTDKKRITMSESSD